MCCHSLLVLVIAPIITPPKKEEREKNRRNNCIFEKAGKNRIRKKTRLGIQFLRKKIGFPPYLQP
jgi:hypothetical protein